jgi:hypothetical protein
MKLRSSRGIRLRAGFLSAALLLPALALAAIQDRVSDETVRMLRGPLANKARVQLDRFPVDGVPRTLDLERFEVWAPDAEVVAEGDGVKTRLAVPATRLFRGRIVGEPDSLVFLAVDGGVSGFITRNDRRYDVHSTRRRARGATKEDMDVFVEEAPVFDDALSAARGFTCGVEGREMRAPSGRFAARSESLGGLIPAPTGGGLGSATATRTLNIAIEADSRLYINQFGSSTTTTNAFITNVVGAASTIYQRDLKTDLVIVFSRIQTSAATDPFYYPTSGSDTPAALYNLGDIWHNTPPSAVPHSSVVRLSGTNIGAGIAWIGTACGTDFPVTGGHWGGRYAYCGGLTSSFGVATDGSVPDPNATVNGVQYEAPATNYWALLEFAHELGHNVNADHTHCVALTSADWSTWPAASGRPYVDICYGSEGGCYAGAISVPPEKGTIMSYCHLISPGGNNSRFLLGQSSEPSDKIRQEMLTILTGSAVPDSPAINAPASINSGTTGSASIVGPIGGQTYNWSITNGTIVGSSTGTSINFTGSADPVTLRVRTTKPNAGDTTAACSASDFRNVAYISCQAPAITVQPQSVSITAGAGTSVTLSVTATGSATLSYQWYTGVAPNTSSPIGGATNPSLTVSPSSTTNYWVRVTNSCGTADSTTATVAVVPTGTATSGFFVVTPCRVIDTRNPVGPYGGPALGANALRTVLVGGTCGIPVGAQSISLNLTVVGPSSTGWLTLYPGGGLLPGSSTINYRTGKTRANNAIVPVDAAGNLNVSNSGPAVNFIIDVNGYFQ